MRANRKARWPAIIVSVAVLASTAALALATASPALADPGCQNGGVYILWARGSGQAIGDVEAIQFQQNVQNALDGAGVGTHAWAELGNLDNDNHIDPGEYPAVAVNWSSITGGYTDSVNTGADELVGSLNRRYALPPYGYNCTNETVVLGGFSQGADVIGTALARTSGNVLTPEARSHIGSVALYGDPRLDSWSCPRPQWVRGSVMCQTFGILGRRAPQPDMVNRTVSWCDQGDGVCNQSTLPPGTHTTVYRNSLIQQSAAEVVNVARSKGKSLLQVENTGSGWSAYNLTAAGAKSIQGAPSVVSNGQLVGFGVTPDGKLDQFSVCPGGGSWCSYDLTGANAMSGGVRAVMNGSSYEVFGPSADGSLLQVENNGSGWAVYNLSAANGVKTAGAPGVSWWASGGPTIYAVDKAGYLHNFHIVSGAWQAGTITTSELLSGGVWASSDGTQLFARGIDGHMLQIALSGGVWSTYHIYDGLITSGSPGVIWTSNGPNIYVADAWGALRELYISGGAWQVSVVLPNGAVSSGVDAVQVGSNVELFAASA